jgi:hypothetical protein
MGGTNSEPDGLFEFYASQAEVMLAQYKNIGQLLGPTTHHTHTGTLCEVLLRDVLRRNVLSWMSVDKGFVYGRVRDKQPEGHGPEIDILIHDSHNYRPIFKLDDFVIVQPESVIAMIQVKRTLSTGGENDLKRGICNIAHAMQHILDIKIQSIKERFGDRRPSYPTLDMATNHRIFTAVVAYEDTLRDKTYEEWLQKQYDESKEWGYSNSEFDTGVFILPSFLGSLTGTCLLCPWNCSTNIKHYYVYQSHIDNKNVALQLMLWNLTQYAFRWQNSKPPFSFTGMTSPRSQPILIPALGKEWFRRAPLSTTPPAP